MPKRIQRKRTKGWRMPLGAISVTRPGVFGNPFIVGVDCETPEEAIDLYRHTMTLAAAGHDFGANEDGQHCAAAFKRIAELRGKDLACFCEPDSPCHADILLLLANPELEAAK